MSQDSQQNTTRRRLLVGAAGAAGAVAAGALAGAAPVFGGVVPNANGATVKVGSTNSGTAPTKITNTNGTSIVGASTGGGPGKAGIQGTTNVAGGSGVKGASTGAAGFGLYATSDAGTAGYFKGGLNAVAIDVHGPARFSTSGISTIPSGTSTVQHVGGGAPATARVFATLVQDPGAAVAVKWINIHADDGTIDINLTGNVASDTDVCWLILI